MNQVRSSEHGGIVQASPASDGASYCLIVEPCHLDRRYRIAQPMLRWMRHQACRSQGYFIVIGSRRLIQQINTGIAAGRICSMYARKPHQPEAPGDDISGTNESGAPPPDARRWSAAEDDDLQGWDHARSRQPNVAEHAGRRRNAESDRCRLAKFRRGKAVGVSA